MLLTWPFRWVVLITAPVRRDLSSPAGGEGAERDLHTTKTSPRAVAVALPARLSGVRLLFPATDQHADHKWTRRDVHVEAEDKAKPNSTTIDLIFRRQH